MVEEVSAGVKGVPAQVAGGVVQQDLVQTLVETIVVFAGGRGGRPFDIGEYSEGREER